MDINLKIKRGNQIQPFYLLFIMLGIQIGVGVLGAPRYIFEEARQDAWISVLLAYLYMLLITWIMFVILNRYENADILGIQVDIFGNGIGKLLGTGYLLFLFCELLSVLLTYIEVVQIFIFPTIPSSVMAILLLGLIVYSILGGIRIVVGVVFLFVILSLWVFILLYDPITRMEVSHFLPMFEASIPELLKGARTTSYTFLGLEILFFIYPFLDKRERNVRLPTFLGVSASAFIVFITTIISIGYYSPNDFDLMDWPVLSLFKSVSFSFLERFDYLIIAEWMMVTIPTAVLLMWALTHGAKRLYRIPKKTTLYVVSLGILIICTLITTNVQIQKIGSFVSKAGFWIIFVYPIVLLPIVLLKTRRKPSKERTEDSG